MKKHSIGKHRRNEKENQAREPPTTEMLLVLFLGPRKTTNTKPTGKHYCRASALTDCAIPALPCGPHFFWMADI